MLQRTQLHVNPTGPEEQNRTKCESYRAPRVEQKKTWRKSIAEADSEKEGGGLAKVSLLIIRKQIILK